MAQRSSRLALRWMRRVLPALAALAGVAGFLAVPAAGIAGDRRAPAADDLTEMSLEDLMAIQVTTVSRKPEPAADAAAAIHVVTREDIRRSGATNLPDLLRGAPGVQDFWITASSAAISARGFADAYSQKMLVLIDGHSIYTPFFSGVYWDTWDLVLEDIERIEIIRGPGATMWGANAVNGVINIITRHSRDTLGEYAALAAGAEERICAEGRYGWRSSEGTTWRAYARHFDRDGSVDATGADLPDDWGQWRAGVRMDREGPRGETLLLDVQAYEGRSGQVMAAAQLDPPYERELVGDAEMSGGSLLLRWAPAPEGRRRSALQFSADGSHRRDPLMDERRRTYDLDYQLRVTHGQAHELIGGVAYRLTADEIESTPYVSFDPAARIDHRYSALLQEDLHFAGDRVQLTLGAKFEDDNRSEFELQPAARVRWRPHGRHVLWSAASRAVRRLSRGETSFRWNRMVFPAGEGYPVPAGTPIMISVFGDPKLHSESILALEAGYRWMGRSNLTLDLAAFRNRYDDLLTGTGVPGQPYPEQAGDRMYLVVPVRAGNLGEATTWGGEAALAWTPAPWWRLTASYSHLRVEFETSAAQTPGDEPLYMGSAYAEEQLDLRSSCDLPGRLELDALLHYAGPIEQGDIPAQTRLDTRLGWRATPHLDVSGVVQNLLDDQHREFPPGWFSDSTELQRRIYGMVTWRR